VGVQDFRVPNSVPFHVYYPASATNDRPVSWFRESLASFVFGHAWFALPWLENTKQLARVAVQIVIRIFAFLLPSAYFHVPHLFSSAPPKQPARRLPLIVFSHGLSGTGEEHQLMFVHLSQQGFVVGAKIAIFSDRFSLVFMLL
jgi:predicted dienelactone hydrolase